MGLLGSLVKTTVDVALTPVSAVADIVTLGGMTAGRKEPFTVSSAKDIGNDVVQIVDDIFG